VGLAKSPKIGEDFRKYLEDITYKWRFSWENMGFYDHDI
jgi:hypothetical protein